MLDSPVCFLDLETTGTNPSYNRILEIGILRVENGNVVQKIDTLLNPDTGVPPYIREITGISENDIEYAPTFYEISDEIQDILKNSILVAHSVRFDYGFLKNEFKRIGVSFNNKHFCSVKLARLLYPTLGRYNLDTIIETFGLKIQRRHRAYDDAKAIFDFFKVIEKDIPEHLFTKAIDTALKKPSLPINLSEKVLDKLPEGPGVYIFYGADLLPIYIGKSVNIRDRVLSHFTNDHSSIKDMQIAQQIHNIETITTAGELGALLLESSLIKKYKPLYNSMLREARKMIILFKSEDQDGFSTIAAKEQDRLDVNDAENVIGIFKSQKQLRSHLFELSKQFNLCPKLLGLDHSKKFCFYYHLNICRGACGGKEDVIRYNMRFTEAFHKYKIKRWIFDYPVIISEKGDYEESFIVDKWCLLGSVKNENEIYEIDRQYSFDLDTYKILSKYLLNPGRHLSINKFDLNKLSQSTLY